MSKIFETSHIGNMTMKNRILRAAMGDHDATPDGHYGKKDFNNYERIAEGGVGTIITGYSYVADYPMGGQAKMTGIYNDDFIPEYRLLTNMVHSHNCNIIHQLVHVGSAALPGENKLIGASAVEGPYNGQIPLEMTIDDIERVEQAFADAASEQKNQDLTA